MLIHRKKRPPYGMQAPLTSLIDIVFMLLIYFLLTTNFMTESGIDISLPESGAATEQKRQEITVFIDRTGNVYLGQEPVDFNALFGILKQRIADRPDPMVVIKADRTIALDTAVNVMDVARAAGARRLFLATDKKVDRADL